MTIVSGDTVYFLLVDDLEENLLSLEALLRREGVSILKAHSGPEALELLLQYDVALALLDVQMPGMDGFELAELMRGTERTRTVPIMFLTAGTSDWQRRFRGYEAGAVDFLHKPIETDILRSKVNVFYELYRQRQQISFQRDKLQQSAEALRIADQRKDEFLATLAHELRNPLAPIRNGLQILKMSPGNEQAEDIRDMMDRQLTHLVRLIDDLLDVSRVSQGKIELRIEHISLQDALKAAIEVGRPLIEAQKHHFTIDIPQEPLWLNADLTRVAQIVSNLLNNAAKYTEESGHISLAVNHDGQNAFIQVRDNGVGIPPDMLPKVFELFTQVDQNLERSQGGLGIGLALVKRLAEMHQGDIKVESAGLGKGSTFTLRLPLSMNEEHDKFSEMNNPEPDPATALKILIVDDNFPAAQTIGWMLELLGHQPTLAHDGPQALNQARAIRPDVILLDIGLPGMNGYEVCRTLRQDPLFNNTLMVAQTGWGQEKDKQQARDAGFDHHFIKPMSFEDFSGLLANIKPAQKS